MVRLELGGSVGWRWCRRAQWKRPGTHGIVDEICSAQLGSPSCGRGLCAFRPCLSIGSLIFRSRRQLSDRSACDGRGQARLTRVGPAALYSVAAFTVPRLASGSSSSSFAVVVGGVGLSVSVGGGSVFAQALALLVWDSASTWPIPLASPRVRAHAPARRSGRLFSKFFRGGAGFGFLRSGEGDGFRSVTMAGRMEPPRLLPVLADCWRGGIRTCIARRRPKAKGLTLVSSRARSSQTERRSARGKESEAEERRLAT